MGVFPILQMTTKYSKESKMRSPALGLEPKNCNVYLESLNRKNLKVKVEETIKTIRLMT